MHSAAASSFHKADKYIETESGKGREGESQQQKIDSTLNMQLFILKCNVMYEW